MSPSIATAIMVEILREHTFETFASDLIHDGRWLERHATQPGFEFYWAVGPSGTVIGTDRKLALSYDSNRCSAWKFSGHETTPINGTAEALVPTTCLIVER